MDADFFQELETSISDVGTDELWKETIGGRKIWLSPIPFAGQAKVQEALSSNTLGSNVINESKRLTLSYAIIGIDDIDLRPYRHAGQVFGPIALPGGKTLKVDLATYIYLKLVNWGQQFIDDCFAIFADRMETHGKDNVKEVKFENAKNPTDELGDLMVRVTELRIQLGLPELEEKTVAPTEDEAEAFEETIREQAAADAPKPQVEEPEQSFDPFKTVQVTPASSRPSSRPSSPPVPPTAPVVASPPPPVPDPIVTVPVPTPPQNRVQMGSLPPRARQLAELEGHTSQSSPQNPYVASPSVEQAVIERPQREIGGQVLAPVIDPIQFGRNPRFNPPRG